MRPFMVNAIERKIKGVTHSLIITVAKLQNEKKSTHRKGRIESRVALRCDVVSTKNVYHKRTCLYLCKVLLINISQNITHYND